MLVLCFYTVHHSFWMISNKALLSFQQKPTFTLNFHQFCSSQVSCWNFMQSFLILLSQTTEKMKVEIQHLKQDLKFYSKSEQQSEYGLTEFLLVHSVEKKAYQHFLRSVLIVYLLLTIASGQTFLISKIIFYLPI